MSPTHSTAAVLAAAVLLITACGSDDQTGSGTAAVDDDAPIVVATMSIWADITANVACDGLARVEMVIPPGGDPHSFEPSLRDRETMESADLIVANGLFLEESLADTIDAVENTGVPVLYVGDGIDTISVAEADGVEHSDDDHDSEEHDSEEHDSEGHEGDDHDHGGDDPHVWWDPTRIADAVPLIADELAVLGVDPASLETCTGRYLAELTTLDADIAAIVAPLPVDERLLVTNHDSLAYFADRYDFDVLGSVIPSSSSLAATSPADLDALAADIEATGVSAIFADTQNSSVDADALANRIGNVEVISMLTDTLDEPGTEQGTYLGWLRQNATTIVDALMPSGAS